MYIYVYTYVYIHYKYILDKCIYACMMYTGTSAP